ncbi:MAG: class I SAM-dependent rRNA methyltransferase [Bdellovibrionaceae bacterium]|nr:class I SAM-dependent rRNA methyltransferase [Pseudobdellovibrionaceae bacterium]MBX3034409.1 class I SAM-dependent rRNA methyltransferase [Pseudobdellovibrionaceae bacterium]
MNIWKLKRGADRRVRAGHPWVYANELAQSPKGVVPGGLVELQDDQGRFVARGYGNPLSLIAFRVLSLDSKEKNPLSKESLIERVLEAWKSRRLMGFRASFRLVFSEADRLPGLIVDHYVGEQNGRRLQVFATQILTAGMQQALGDAETFFRDLVAAATERGYTAIPWEQTAVVLRNDVRSRKLEGMSEDQARFIKSVREADFTNFGILLNAATDDGLVEMNCDLFEGQKTGFFLDQTANIATVCRILEHHPDLPKDRPVRVLDLCCYVGHWSSQLTRALRRRGCDVETTLVDISARALEFARKNAERQGAKTVVLEADVMKALTKLEKNYDIVIADPPAFVKARKDLPVGQHAYLKLNTQAFRVVNRDGLVVSCSCSGLLDEDMFKEAIGKSIRRNFLDARCVARGGPAPDHPGRLSFPEGMYLKMFTHLVGDQGAGGGAAAGAGASGAGDED